MTVITALLAQIERTYDAIPRAGGARVEALGPFELFVPDDATPSYYARPRLGTSDVRVADVEAVTARQRELGVPQAIEWVNDVTPALLPAVRAAGLPVLLAPLMVLDPARLPEPSTLSDAELLTLDPDTADFADLYAISRAVAHLGFSAAGTAPGGDGPAERDAVVAAEDPAPQRTARAVQRIRAGIVVEAVARTVADGVVARGAYQRAHADDAPPAAEVVGVATLPSARRRGLGAAVSAYVAGLALRAGHEIVFLGAANEDVARVYARIGFTRIGTACISEG